MEINQIRHSLAHLLAAAVKAEDLEAKFGVGPEIDNGFYYDIKTVKPLSESDLSRLEEKMRLLIKQDLKFEQKTVSIAEAKKIFADQPFKLELINDLETKGTTQVGDSSGVAQTEVSIYQVGDFTDLCQGPHVDKTSAINPNAFKLIKLAGAYWRGNEKNPMLTRIYGVAFSTAQELADYLNILAEAEKRDHRKIGKDLELFLIDPMVGLGLALWQPKGARLWRVMEDFWYQEHLKAGYDLVRTPHIGNRQLWETSGHWGFYSGSMYPSLEVGQSLEEAQKGEKTVVKEEYLLKPMNCPFHIVLYKSRPRSYRELPIRWAECGTVYRYEKSGELSGLTRVRGFTQDDAHIICRADNVETELKRVIDFILFIYKSFGFGIESVNVYLSVRDPESKKYAGTDEGWNFTESVLEKVALEKGLNISKDVGGAVFYGPKLDFKIKDTIGREWQCSTLQFDFNLPERFDLTFINDQGEKERPYMLHRALFGSFERFIGVLLEHYAGALPLWLSPVQVKILPVSDKFIDYANSVADALRKNSVRVEIDSRSESLGKKIREAEMQKTPYMVIVGEKEQTAQVVRPRHRSAGDSGEMSVEKFTQILKQEIEDKIVK